MASGAQPTLRDVIVDELLAARNPDRPLVSRMAFAGEIVSKDEPLKQFFEELVSTAQKATNEADPLGGRMHPDSEPYDVVFIGGIFVELQQHFVLLVESEPTHLLNLAVELHRRLTGRKAFDGVRNAHVIFYSDDVVQRSFPRFFSVEAATSIGSINKTKKLEEHIVEAVHGLMTVGKLLESTGKVQADGLLKGLKASHPQHLPRSGLVEACLECGLLLTLDEYVQIYSEVPVVVRPSEVNYPIEPTLKYEP
jgi:hypothetical protein